MLETEPALYEVVGRQNNHLWLEVLGEQDQGIRVSVPVHSEDYSPELQEEVLELSVEDVVKLKLKSDAEDRPDWYIDEICEIRKRRDPIPA